MLFKALQLILVSHGLRLHPWCEEIGTPASYLCKAIVAKLSCMETTRHGSG
jgi:hypothetical protein